MKCITAGAAAACPSLARAEQAAAAIWALGAGASVEAAELDLRSQASVRRFAARLADSLAAARRPLQLLVNNAGAVVARRRWTEDDLDCMVAANYLGPVLLTQLLLPMLCAAPLPARVINLASLHPPCRKLHVDPASLAAGATSDLAHEGPRAATRPYAFAPNYAASKLCMTMFSLELHRQLRCSADCSRVSCVAVDPGLVLTHLLRELPTWYVKLGFGVGRCLGVLRSPEQAAATVMLAIDLPEEASGGYVFGSTFLSPSRLAQDKEIGRELWDATMMLTTGERKIVGLR
eukprot:SM000027S09698  [mRNA]  locus=s27:873998:875904:- [translate_table: standard]